MDQLLDQLKCEMSDFSEKIGDLAVTTSVTPTEIREYLQERYDLGDRFLQRSSFGMC